MNAITVGDQITQVGLNCAGRRACFFLSDFGLLNLLEKFHSLALKVGHFSNVLHAL